MKKFVLKISFVFFLVWALCLGLKCFIPFYLGGGYMGDKIEYLMSNQDKYNTLVIGSSLIIRHLDATIFDENNNKGTKTFNLGMSGMFFLESEYITEHILKQNLLPNIENIVFLVQAPERINQDNFHSIRGKYFLDRSRYIFTLKYFKSNLQHLKQYSLSYLENLFCIGEMEMLFNYYAGTRKTVHNKYATHHGFKPYPRPTNKKVNLNFLEKRKKKTYKQIDTVTYKEQLFLERFRNLTAINPEINFYFLHMPDSPFVTIMKDFDNIHLKYPETFPEYYDVEYQYDGAEHLNKAGAKIFSKRLGQLYDKVAD